MNEKKEYIERGAVVAYLKERRDDLEELHRSHVQGIKKGIEIGISSISDPNFFKAADVEPVVRGEWKPDDRMFGVWHCSVCGESALCNGVEEEVKSAFCPHCGAKMNMN